MGEGTKNSEGYVSFSVDQIICCSMLPFFRYKKHSPSNTFFERPLERSHMTLMLVVNNNDTII